MDGLSSHLVSHGSGELLSAASHAMHVSDSALCDGHRGRNPSNSSPAERALRSGSHGGQGVGRAEGSRRPDGKVRGEVKHPQYQKRLRRSKAR
jgi:hypothetical protein